MIAYSRAELLLRERLEYDDGTFVEMVIWRVPAPVQGSSHEYKYRLFYGRGGERLVGYDNERSRAIIGTCLAKRRSTCLRVWNHSFGIF